MSTRFAWLVSLPVAIAGCLAAHVFGYLIAVPDPHARAALLERTGHQYLGHLPLLAGAGLSLALAAAAAHATRGRLGARPSPWLFALLPPLAFVLQEHLERLLASGALPLGTTLQPAFLIGLALQLPFALLAYAIVAVVLRAAEAVRRLLVRPPRPKAQLAQRLSPDFVAPGPPARSVATAQRGPPAGVAVLH
jgi:hypothetical protein